MGVGSIGGRMGNALGTSWVSTWEWAKPAWAVESEWV
jgi:hypothetical protein